ncbi:hypothetical protein MUK42_16420 [Musa troglodytarum]|uniref:Uncharacterized protein n=1 Tax=Musa troglodytarum TaxID=320322 RepID=A0A9E7HZR7_9LILI|nr:hypothetical protein MUK42_16420 [Musa troglodytarum]
MHTIRKIEKKVRWLGFHASRASEDPDGWKHQMSFPLQNKDATNGYRRTCRGDSSAATTCGVSSHKLLEGESREGEQPRSSIPAVQCDSRRPPRSMASNVSHMLHIRWESNLHLHLFIFLLLQCEQLSQALDQSLQRSLHLQPR